MGPGRVNKLPFAYVGEFRLDAVIQDGPYSMAVRGFQPNLKRPVFIKLLKPHIQYQQQWIIRFRRESQICADLKSPHIVDVYTVGEQDGFHYLVLEYVDGQSLAEALEKQGRLPVAEALDITRQIVLALKTAHAHGIIHRDLKPGNILIDERGVAKLTDFGMAYLGEEVSITQQNSIIGTPAYMAPEQVTGEAITPATDFFSLGASLYEMLTGVRPFDGDNYSICLQKILNETPPPPSHYNSEIVNEIDAFILHLLEKEKDERLRSAAKALQQLDKLHPALLERREAVTSKLFTVAGNEKTPDAKEQTRENDQAMAATKEAVPWRRRLLMGALFFVIIIAAVIGFRFLTIEKSVTADPTIPELKTNSLLTGQREQTIKKDESRAAARQEHEGKIQNVNKSAGAVSESEKQLNLTSETALKSVTTSNQKLKVEPANMDTLATLHIHVKPWAAISINGQVVDSMTVNWQKQMPPGHYNVVLAHPEFSPKIFSIELQQGQPDTVFYSFLRQAAYLSVSVRPWADIYIDGKYIDSTPLKRPIALDGGTHEIELKNPYYKTHRQLVRATPGDTLVIQKRLQK